MNPQRINTGARRAVFPLLLAVLIPSCSKSDLNRVEGKVLVDGKPAEGAVVIFHPRDGGITAARPSGIAKADGTFTLSTGIKDGAPAGEYTVTVVWPGEAKPLPKGKALDTELREPDRPDRLGGRYADAKTSTLKATVKSGTTRLEPFNVR